MSFGVGKACGAGEAWKELCSAGSGFVQFSQ